MKNLSKVFTILYLIICSVTVLVMLTTSFELFKEKYMPSFMLAQKYALPLIISAMAVAFLAFFEPERLQQKKTLNVMQLLLAVTFALFSYYLTSLDMKEASAGTLTVYILQWCAILVETVYFFVINRNTKAAS
jgi:drug/metabolite transporter (DMT)-like permease